MDLRITTTVDPMDLADELRTSPQDSELQTTAWDLANMAGEEFSDVESLASAVECLPGYLVLADPDVIRNFANGRGIIDLSGSNELCDALGSREIWERVVEDLRTKNISIFYGTREFFWIS